jgi:thiol:disulfide interchange protein DsbD
MKKALFILSFFAIAFGIYANFSGSEGKLDPVKWESKLIKTGNNEYLIQFEAEIEPHWHVYSSTIADGGPVATTIAFDSLIGIKAVESIQEIGTLVTEYDPNFDMDLKWFDTKVVFSKKLIAEGDQFRLVGYLQYMTCDDKQCLPPTYVDVTFTEKDATEGSAITLDNVEAESNKQDSFIWIFLACFAGGLIALLTPCVFPMIPLTVSFFTKQSKNKAEGIRNAVIYGLSIIAIYVTIGLIVTMIFGENALNALSTNPWLNLSFFVLFVIFAASFFGAFEIRLPNKWVNNADQASNKGGLLGIFFMAATLGLISFSCTGPIIGSLLVEAANHGGVAGPAIGMLGFSTALALPFTLFAMFPGWLNSLPKSGGWLNSVKVVLGFLEVALALKFLSVADLVMHWGFLDREVFISLWIAVAVLLALYLLGKLKFSHDSDLPYISVPRLFMAIVTLSFAVYLLPGLWGAPLKAISGFLPHMGTQDFNITMQHGSSHASPQRDILKKGSENLHCAHEIDCFFDYEQALAIGREENKPVMIDFTGHGCVNCRKMENTVWVDNAVLEVLRNKVILVELYVDDRTELAETHTTEEGKKLRTVGDKWSEFQSKKFSKQSQPYYVFIDPFTEEVIHGGRAYNEDIPAYLEWLNKGLEMFAKAH